MHSKIVRMLRNIVLQAKCEIEMQNKQLVAELQIMSRHRHPNLCVLLGFASTASSPPRRCLIYELCPQGCLRSRLSHNESSDASGGKAINDQTPFTSLPFLSPAQRLTIAMGIGMCEYGWWVVVPVCGCCVDGVCDCVCDSATVTLTPVLTIG